MGKSVVQKSWLYEKNCPSLVQFRRLMTTMSVTRKSLDFFLTTAIDLVFVKHSYFEVQVRETRLTFCACYNKDGSKNFRCRLSGTPNCLAVLRKSLGETLGWTAISRKKPDWIQKWFSIGSNGWKSTLVLQTGGKYVCWLTIVCLMG